jgi:hypothetical protein
MVGDAFISMVDKVEECREKWHGRYGTQDSPVKGGTLSEVVFEDWFGTNDDKSLKRAIHIDIAYSSAGDSLGISMGHVPQLLEVENELQPVIVFDFIARVRALPGRQIILSDIRQLVYRLRNDFGFNIKRVSLDGFQSTDTFQQLRKNRFDVQVVSVDKNTRAYEDLREAIYAGRLEFPEYVTFYRHGDTRKIEIAVQELLQLTDDGKKIDHPPGGSKDVADSMAGVVYTLMGDRQYRRGVSASDYSSNNTTAGPAGYRLPQALQGSGLPPMPRMPSFPRSAGSLGGLMPPVPNRLTPNGDN